jgi:kynureninase
MITIHNSLFLCFIVSHYHRYMLLVQQTFRRHSRSIYIDEIHIRIHHQETGVPEGRIRMTDEFRNEEKRALEMDEQDLLAVFKNRFYTSEDSLYMDGNSLGLCSKDAEDSVSRVMGEWREKAIGGWLEGNPPWFELSEHAGAKAAKIVGAEPDEVILAGTTTTNLHTLVATFYHPDRDRYKILADPLNFPSDLYAIKSQVALRGLDPKDALIMPTAVSDRYLDEDEIVAKMDDGVCLILLPSVLYRSGQLLDMKFLTREANLRNIPIGFDCSHSAGVIPHRFDKWGVDFAFWCSYKYLNGGPGSTAYLYVNKRHFGKVPALAGWFGCDKSRQFDMDPVFYPARTAGAWQISTPSIISSAAAEGGLQTVLDAGIDRIREKSLRLTGFFMELVDKYLSDSPYGFEVGNPREDHRRGGHVALEHPEEALRINEALKERNVIPDFRPPNVIRIAPVPLYTSFHDVWRVASHLKEIMDSGAYRRFSKSRKAVS